MQVLGVREFSRGSNSILKRASSGIKEMQMKKPTMNRDSLIRSKLPKIVKDSDKPEKEGPLLRTVGTLSGGATAAALGALVGSAIPLVGTAAGAIVGGAIGSVMGFFSKEIEDAKKNKKP